MKNCNNTNFSNITKYKERATRAQKCNAYQVFIASDFNVSSIRI